MHQNGDLMWCIYIQLETIRVLIFPAANGGESMGNILVLETDSESDCIEYDDELLDWEFGKLMLVEENCIIQK